MNTIEFGRFRLQTGLRVEATQLNILGFLVTNNANGNYISTVTPRRRIRGIGILCQASNCAIASPMTLIFAPFTARASRGPNPYDMVPYVTLDQQHATAYTSALEIPNLKPSTPTATTCSTSTI